MHIPRASAFFIIIRTPLGKFKANRQAKNGIKIKPKEENNNPWHDISNVRPMDEECGNPSSLIGGIWYSAVAMAYMTVLVRGWKIKMAGKTVPGFVLKSERKSQ